MSPQLTLQTPLQLPPAEIPTYLDQLWAHEERGDKGANTFCLIIWQPAWIEQKLVKSGKLSGPIVGSQRVDLIEAARQIILDGELPNSTSPLDFRVQSSIESKEFLRDVEDLRGQHIDTSISNLQPRRLITIAPTIEKENNLETLVAAYCPLPEEGGGKSACGDVIVLRGNKTAINDGLEIVETLVPDELPSWLWWNGRIDEAPDFLKALALPNRRLIIDTALGEPADCLSLLLQRIKSGQAVNDLNWLRLRGWRETLAMVFDPLQRRNVLNNLEKIDIDIQGSQSVQGLLLAAWIADRLNWKLRNCVSSKKDHIKVNFIRPDKAIVAVSLTSLPIGKPSINPGQIVGLRLIARDNNKQKNDICVILASESGECMRLEAGGMARMELIEQVVPIQKSSLENDVARLLSSSRGNTSPLLASATPIAIEILNLVNQYE
ncbi:glucose-6-phosphate dehydrogenase assembly protein OpcA [Prochlorococcus marinus]|uniref:Glucose 6-phosphate dehydrogenase n=1 Tax=Prochlorococcus marinus XMU1408 TaxID=2213228 RepID=A0A318R2A8_PROMR|nr:glucose-6-phosphate dehydrogenase assembly protein OpcA [Prochlorococcus marinus]MBW3042284.1 glucose 6-phosphate dehydrogenase [Prochlorococcus marinus str. XMU1408]PYE01672.1 glucose 6-phosphate dehydrogenase [Prochlorococcus marinus XMU1408]